MTDETSTPVTLDTLHADLGGMRGDIGELRGEIGELRGEMRTGFSDLKATLIAGFRGLPSRESSDEMVRLLRENNRLQEERFSQLDLRMREQHFETQQVLHALAEGQRVLIDSHRTLTESHRALTDEVRNLSQKIDALIARLDALIKGRGNGERPA